ncbi:MAG: diadenylate cyclase CdaA [Fibrobacterota bacterium]
MTLFKAGFITVTLYDVVDIIIVAGIIYTIVKWLKGTRSVQMFFAILLLILVSLLADLWHLHGLSWIMSNIKTIGLLAFFIVFQPEIRAALTRLGQVGIGDLFFKKERRLIPVDKIAEGAVDIAKRGLGGLIVISRKVGLRHVLETGKPLDAEITPELLSTLFGKNTPLHDGAVVITGDRILAAACVLPLLSNPGLDERHYGMRHRAALGLAAETDAIILVISEQTGEVSIAHGKDFVRGLSQKELKSKIEFYLDQ